MPHLALTPAMEPKLPLTKKAVNYSVTTSSSTARMMDAPLKADRPPAPSWLLILRSSPSSALPAPAQLRVAMPLWSDAGFHSHLRFQYCPGLDLGRQREPTTPAICAPRTVIKSRAPQPRDFVYEVLGLRKAATIHDGSIYADSLQQVFVDKFKELGGTITAQESVSPIRPT